MASISEPSTDFSSGDTISISINASSSHDGLFLALPLSHKEFNYTVSSISCEKNSASKLSDVYVLNLKVKNNKCIVDLLILNVLPSKTLDVHWYPVSNHSNCLSLNKNLLQLHSKPVRIYYSTSRDTTDLLAGEAFSLTVNLEFPKTKVDDLTINISFVADESLDL